MVGPALGVEDHPVAGRVGERGQDGARRHGRFQGSTLGQTTRRRVGARGADGAWRGRDAGVRIAVADRLRVVPPFAVFCRRLFPKCAWLSHGVTKEFFWRG
jgi:hypothetical protein